MKRVRTRIAPSPTGEDLHIGTVYMALFNYVFAKQKHGDFIVRIEDTDRVRYVPKGELKMLFSLDWVGIPHDEGVDVGGKYAPYRQSERLPIYQKYVHLLLEKGDAYYCFCSEERLSKLRITQQQQKKPPMYDGLCKNIPYKTACERAKSEKFVVRLNVPDKGETIIKDVVRGKVIFENKLIDDQILLKSDGYPTYHLAVVVDDYLMEISHVIRGEEWLSSTPKHMLLYEMLGWSSPVFAHLPLLRNPDKSKLSKRRNPVWLSWFRKEGFLPEAILNYLGTLTWSMPAGQDIFSLQDMMKQFSLKAIKTTAPVFDIQKLLWFNGEYIRSCSSEDLVKKIQKYVPNMDIKLIEKLVPLARMRMKKLSEFEMYVKPFINFVPVKLNSEQISMVIKFYNFYQNVSRWDFQKLHEISQKLVKEENMNLKSAFMALRLAITGEKIGLPLFETMEIIGKKQILFRLKEIYSAHDNK